ncbi:hypothetical protein [Dinghuibacter silviterrae]|nr:hypothetical protein [Dinghuibacter silviterrae]
MTKKKMNITNIEELAAARKVVRKRVKEDEALLKERLQELPGQLFYTGVKYVVPPLLSGGVTNTVLGAGKSLIDLFFIKKEDGAKNGLPTALKKAGILTALKWGVRLLLKSI